ncbi:MAG: hypothetical protein IJH04_06250, partial [Eggerthellaceae bacterium]|nr:hypothetical protein [Eggerthellaceae bacterium]
MFERRKEIRNVDTIQANQLLQASTGSSTSKLSRRAQALDHLRLRREEGASGFYSHREDIAQAAESSSTSHDNGTAERRRKARSSSQRGAGSNGQSAREAADANGMTSVDASRQRRSRTTAAAGTSPDTARPYRRAQTGSGAESASAASRQRRKPQQATAKAASADVRQNSNRRPAGSNRPRTRTTSPAQRQIALWRGYGVYAFVAIMFVGCILGLAFFARPTASAFEKRDLTPFPTITIESFLDGSFFSDVSLWYADTYPA